MWYLTAVTFLHYHFVFQGQDQLSYLFRVASGRVGLTEHEIISDGFYFSLALEIGFLPSLDGFENVDPHCRIVSTDGILNGAAAHRPGVDFISCRWAPAV